MKTNSFKGLHVDSVTKVQSNFHEVLVTVGAHNGYGELGNREFGSYLKTLVRFDLQGTDSSNRQV